MREARLILPILLLGLVAGCVHPKPMDQPPVQATAPAGGSRPQAAPADTSASGQSSGQRTAVGQQADEIRAGSERLRGDLEQRQHDLAEVRGNRGSHAADYYARVADINSRLQAGTTPANPELVAQWRAARADLSSIEASVSRLSESSAALTDDAAVALYLSNQVRATLALPGAVDQDHVELIKLGGEIEVLQVQISQTLEQVLNEVNRQNEVLAVEYRNIATLSRAVEVGQILGESLASVQPNTGSYGEAVGAEAIAPPRPAFHVRRHRRRRSSPTAVHLARTQAGTAGAPGSAAGGTGATETVKSAAPAPSGKPIIVISGDLRDNAYEDRLYAAVSAALEHSPGATFNIRAVALAQPSAGRWAIQAVELQQKANAVLRSLTAYGLPRSRIAISQGTSDALQAGEIEVFAQ